MGKETMLGKKLKALREMRGWSQYKLSMLSGIPRSSISLIELGQIINPRADVLIKIADVFRIPIEELYQAAGYVKEDKATYRHQETPEELLNRAKAATPITLEVCRDFTLHAGEPVEPTETVLIDRTEAVGKDLYAYKVQGDCLAPEIQDGDRLILDRRADVEAGDIIAAQVQGMVHIGRLKKVGDELWLENNHGRFKLEDCEIVAKVIEVNRRLA